MTRRNKTLKQRRIFTRRKSRWLPLLALAAVIVTGCAQDAGDYSQVQSSKDIQVRWITLDHAVLFDPGVSVLSTSERFRLDAFVGGLALRDSDRFRVDVGGVNHSDPVASARTSAIVQRLRLRKPAFSGGQAPSQGVRLEVGRYVALPPNCPDWSRPSSSNPGNVNDSNFGCSAATNLSLMIADPGDLVRGRSLTPGDGQALSLGIQRYRAGKVKNPIGQETNDE
jgi:pilus assembly protein CpaD